MPLIDLICGDENCNYSYIDKYFPTRAEMQELHFCPECGGPLTIPAPQVVFHSFKPFTHMTKDRRVHRISTEGQRQEMMKRYGLAPSEYSDTVEAKTDPREFKQCIKEEKRDFPERYRKLKEKVKIAPVKEAEALAARAQATKFETVRA